MKLIALSTVLVASLFSLPGGGTDTNQPPAGWSVDAVHSSVVFKIKHAGASWFYGTFTGVKGTFSFDADKPADSKIDVTIDAQSIATRDEKRDQHLRGSDFFDAKQFPDITFKSTKVSKDGDGFSVVGDLTLRGETKPVTAKIVKTGEGEFMGKRVGYEATFTIMRRDFGVKGGQADAALGNEVMVTVAIEGVQAK